MKRKSVFGYLKPSFAVALLIAGSLISCKEVKHEVVTQSCADTKADTTGYTKELNNINHSISLERALQLTDNYARSKDIILSGKYGDQKELLPDYETFNLQSIDSLMCQDETVGFRIYLGLDENNKIRLVLAGVDANGIDLLQETRQQKGALNTQKSMRATAAAPPPPPSSKNTLLLEDGQRHP